MESLVPDSDDELRVANGHRAGKMHCAGASERVNERQQPSVTLNRHGEFNRTRGSPILLPGSLGFRLVQLVKIVAATGCRERGSNFWISRTT
jgi:hypothetical protein